MGELHIFTVGKMHCAGCAAAVERAVKKVPGTAEVYVNFAAGKLSLRSEKEYPGDEAVIAAVKQAGFTAELPAAPADTAKNGDSAAGELISFGVCAVSAAALLAVCHSGLPFTLSGIIQIFLLVPVVICGRGFFFRGLPALFRGTPNMDSLISCGAAAGVIYSVVQLLCRREAHLYFDASGMIITLIMLGKMLEARARRSASGAIKKLLALAPQEAHLVKDGVEITVPCAELLAGDTVRIRPGEKIPADGTVIDGASSVDEAMLTGESTPAAKHPGAKVCGGTLNLDGTLLVKLSATGGAAVLGQIVELVEKAQSSRAPAAALADKVSGFFVWGIFTLAALTALCWGIYGSGAAALHYSLSVLVVACPCALGLATPVALICGIGRGASCGILIKSGAALEKAAQLKNLVFDKTGTLTGGTLEIKAVKAANMPETEFCRYAAALERFSSHPLAQAVTAAFPETGEALTVSGFTDMPGFGISGMINGKNWSFGNMALMKKRGVALPEVPEEMGGYTLIYGAENDKFAGVIALGDTLRQESAEVVAELRQLGIGSFMFTGDNRAAAAKTAEKLHLSGFRAELTPEGKFAALKELQSRGSVGMVGDGINDAPALAAGDLGIALGSGSDIALESAAVVILRSDLREVVRMIRLSRGTFRIIKQNLFWAFFYNLIGIPLAAGVFASWGITLAPAFCAGAMAASSLTVVLNALRLLRFK